MVGKFLTIEAMRETLLDLRQHGSVPVIPLEDEAMINVLLAVLEVGALERVFHNIEQERVVEDFEELVITIPDCSLRIRLLAPDQLARERFHLLIHSAQEIHA